MRSDVRTDPALIREVLAHFDATGNQYATAKTFGVTPRSVRRWRDRRDRMPQGWPTDADIGAWRADQRENAAERARRAAQTRRYRDRVYLNRGPLQLPSLGTTRRLRALFAIGWNQHDMAKYLGVSPARVGHLMSGRWNYVFPSTHEAVSAMYEQLCMVVPVDRPPTKRGEIRVHQRTRNLAARRGYLPPLAWDDIDDPTERGGRGAKVPRVETYDEVNVLRHLAGDNVPSRPVDKREAMRRWLGQGRTERSLCELLGWKAGRYLPDDMERTA